MYHTASPHSLRLTSVNHSLYTHSIVTKEDGDGVYIMYLINNAYKLNALFFLHNVVLSRNRVVHSIAVPGRESLQK